MCLESRYSRSRSKVQGQPGEFSEPRGKKEHEVVVCLACLVKTQCHQNGEDSFNRQSLGVFLGGGWGACHGACVEVRGHL